MNTEAQYKKVLDYIAEKMTCELRTHPTPGMRCTFINGPVQYGLIVYSPRMAMPSLSAIGDGTVILSGMISRSAAEYFETQHKRACGSSMIDKSLESFFRMTVDELLVAIDLDMSYSKNMVNC